MDKKAIRKLQEEREKVGLWGNIDKAKLTVIDEYAGNKILDVGCSSGDYVRYLCNRGYDAFGCDILKDDAWNDNFKGRYKVADIYKLPYKDKTFDTTIVLEVLEHISDIKRALNELCRVTRNNIIISVPNCNLPAVFSSSGLSFFHNTDRTHVNFFTLETLKKTLSQNKLKVDYLKLINPIMPESALLYSWHFPSNIALFTGKIFQRIPFNRKFYADMIVVASR